MKIVDELRQRDLSFITIVEVPNRAHWYDNDVLYVEVIFELFDGKSPDQIAGRMLEQGWNHHISTRAIYDYIQQNKENGGQFHKLLRYQGKKYKWRGYGKNTARIPNRKGIEDRPEIVDAKERCGDWESDLVVSCLQSQPFHRTISTCIGTGSCVEMVVLQMDHRV